MLFVCLWFVVRCLVLVAFFFRALLEARCVIIAFIRYCSWFVVRCSLSVVCCLLCGVRSSLFFAVWCHVLFVCRCWLLVVRCSVFVVCCCCLLSVVCYGFVFVVS